MWCRLSCYIIFIDYCVNIYLFVFFLNILIKLFIIIYKIKLFFCIILDLGVFVENFIVLDISIMLYRL